MFIDRELSGFELRLSFLVLVSSIQGFEPPLNFPPTFLSWNVYLFAAASSFRKSLKYSACEVVATFCPALQSLQSNSTCPLSKMAEHASHCSFDGSLE
jgi:hypothetical protein